jgi:hypothetical protein
MTFTVEQVLKAQQALRAAAGLPEERLSTQAFICMLSDEIQALRESGKSDAEITSLLNNAAGTDIPSSDVAQHYASTERRRR